MTDAAGPRFLKLEDVAEELNISMAQTYALVRSGTLAAIKIGGRGQWRVERTALEQYVAQAYADTAAFIASSAPSDEELAALPAD
jgi:excisionase family DNA binding protein